MIIGYVLDDTLDKSDGVQQAMITIGEKMRSLGHEVHYLVTDTKRADLENIHSLSGYYSMKFNGNSIRTPKPSSKKTIRKLLSEIKFDVLHVQMPYSPLMSARVVKLAPKTTKIFGTFHILPYNFSSRVGTKILGKYLYKTTKQFNKVFAVSEPARIFMKSTFGVDGEVLPNPISYKFFSSFAGNIKPKRIVFVGRFDERKGVKQLIKTFSLINDGVTELVMCGKGPLWDEVNATVQRDKLNVILPGFVSEEEKAKYLSSADIAIFPSTGGESFGIVLAEAMACGAGITLGGNNPGYSSVLSDWQDTLFNPFDSALLAEKINTFLTDSSRKREIATEQHDYVKNFDVDLITKRLENYYSEVQ